MRRVLRENLLKYYHSIAVEFMSKYNRVKDLIGEKHWPSVGDSREEILRSFLKEYLPRRFDVSTGFVYRDSGEISKEIDILIWDSHQYSPIHRQGDFVIVPPEAVVAAIEVKSNLGKKELNKGLENLYSLKELVHKVKRDPIFSAIFSFKKEKNKLNTLLNYAKDYYRNKPSIPADKLLCKSIDPQSFFVDEIVILEPGIIFQLGIVVGTTRSFSLSMQQLYEVLKDKISENIEISSIVELIKYLPDDQIREIKYAIPVYENKSFDILEKNLSFLQFYTMLLGHISKVLATPVYLSLDDLHGVGRFEEPYIVSLLPLTQEQEDHIKIYREYLRNNKTQ